MFICIEFNTIFKQHCKCLQLSSNVSLNKVGQFLSPIVTYIVFNVSNICIKKL